jgi:hypothetical protein
MFKPSNERAERTSRALVAAIGFAAFAVPFAALSSLTAKESHDPAIVAAPGGAPKAGRAAGPYRLRCWQFGRLLFEENYLTLPADLSPYQIRLRGNDRDGNPLYVAETKTATCLVQVPVQRDRPNYP